MAQLMLTTACVHLPATRAVEQPQPEVTDLTEFYDIEGDSSAAMRASLNERGPTDAFGRHDALTAWYVTWSYDYQRTDRSCALVNVTTQVKTTYTMPRWENPRAPSALAARWRQYLSALATHERGHTQVAIEAARTIGVALSVLPPEPSCERMESVANGLGEHELDSARQRDVVYDAETKHGETQGATFR